MNKPEEVLLGYELVRRLSYAVASAWERRRFGASRGGRHVAYAAARSWPIKWLRSCCAPSFTYRAAALEGALEFSPLALNFFVAEHLRGVVPARYRRG